MKNNFLRFIAFFCMITIFVTCCGCSLDVFSPEESSNTSNKNAVLKTQRKGYDFEPVVDPMMPVIRITTSDSDNSFATDYSFKDKKDKVIKYVNAYVSTDNCPDSQAMNRISAQVKARGNYSLNYAKKSLKIKFFEKQNLFGLSSGRKYKEWVLLADWKDISLCNNVAAFYLGNTILGSDGYYCTDFRPIELYINEQYWGVYLLAEMQEVDTGRVEIFKPTNNHDEKSIGYFLEFDGYFEYGDYNKYFALDYYDSTFYQKGFTIKSDIYNPSQTSFVSKYMQGAYDILYNAVKKNKYYEFDEDFKSIRLSKFKDVKTTVEKVIDLQSLVDAFIINEICCDPDLRWSSFYMTVDFSENGSKKIVFQAPWDFDSSFGIKKGFEEYDNDYAFDSLNPWFVLLKDQEWFLEMVSEKWEEIKNNNVLNETLELINTYKTIYSKHYERNFERWSTRIEMQEPELIEEANAFKNQTDAADYLYDWLAKRFDYLDSKWSNNRG